jgi:hypothetical protein
MPASAKMSPRAEIPLGGGRPPPRYARVVAEFPGRFNNSTVQPFDESILHCQKSLRSQHSGNKNKKLERKH